MTISEPWALRAVELLALGIAGYIALVVRLLRTQIADARRETAAVRAKTDETLGQILSQVLSINGRLRACEHELTRLTQWREDHHVHDELAHDAMAKEVGDVKDTMRKEVGELKESIRTIHQRINQRHG